MIDNLSEKIKKCLNDWGYDHGVSLPSHRWEDLHKRLMNILEPPVEIFNIPEDCHKCDYDKICPDKPTVPAVKPKKRSLYTSSIITDDNDQQESEQSSEILRKFEQFGFRSVQLALVKFGKVPEFPIQSPDVPYTYVDGEIRKALDIKNEMIIPEMSVLDEKILKTITSCLMKLNENFKAARDLVVCYWYKTPLIGIVIMNETTDKITSGVPVLGLEYKRKIN